MGVLPTNLWRCITKMARIGEWAFIVGAVLAVLFGFVPANYIGMATLVLVIMGLIVGLMNVTEKETTPFLVAAIALIATQNASESLKGIPPQIVGAFLASAVQNLAVFVAPGAIVVALKAIKALAKD